MRMGNPGDASGARACAPVDPEVERVLSDLLDKIALRTPKEKKYLSKRCTHVDDEGTQCVKWGTHQGASKRHLCVAHGGKKVCVEPGCHAWVTGAFCPKHKGQPCVFKDCTNRAQFSSGYCHKHHIETRPVPPEHPDYEIVRRLKRDRALRDKWLCPILAQQSFQCARGVVTCEAVDDGDATPACSWGDRRLPPDAADVDHIQPVCENGSDNRANLQVLCKCCHGLKSAAEARARAAKRTREAA